MLEEKSIISYKELFYLYYRVTKSDKKIKAGEYQFDKKTSLYKVIKNFHNNDLIYRKITIPECYTVEKTLALLKSNQYIIGDVLKIPKEGTLFPDTYYYLRNDNINSLLIRMKDRMVNKIKEVKGINFKYLKSNNDLLILASLIEAEAKFIEEKYLVSSVFHNRLKNNMKLQSDPTILYGKNLLTKLKTKKIYKEDLKKDHPWNTYTRKGMPLTPICNPGLEAIKAAANPYITNYLYFVSDGQGGHRFSKNLDQHNKNVKIWKRIKNEK